MGAKQVQQDREFALSWALSSKPDVITLPANFWESYNTCIYTAEELAKSFPGIQDFEVLAQSVNEIGEIVRIIDEAIECLDLSDALLPRVSRLLLKQSLVLQLRYFFGDPEDFLRAIYILELLPQLCDPADTDFSRHVSVILRNFISLAPKCFLDTRRPSEPRLFQLIESSGVPPDFMARAQSFVKHVNDILHVPTEVSGCSPQSPIIRGIDQIISTVDSVAEQCNASNHDLEAMARLLSVQVMALQARFRLLGNNADLDRASSVFGAASQFCSGASDRSYDTLRIFAFARLDNSVDDPRRRDANIAIGRELLKHLHDVRIQIRVSARLAGLLYSRFARQDSVADGECTLQLCEDILPFVTGVDRPNVLATRAFSLVRLSRLGKQFSDLSQSLGALEGGLDVPSRGTSIELHYKPLFLWTQLGNAAVAGDKQAAVFAFREIQARGYLYYEGAATILSLHSESSIPDMIDKLKQRCHAIHSQEETFEPFTIILVIALLWRYELGGDLRYLREALALRSQLGPSGSYGFDMGLYKAAADDHSDVEKRPELVEAIAASARGTFYQYPEISGWKITPGQRGDHQDRGNWGSHLFVSYMSRTRKDHSEDALEEMRKYAYSRNGDDLGFQISHRELLLQLSASKADSRQYYKALVNLGDLYVFRYFKQDETKDLEDALDWYQQALDALEGPEDSQTLLLKTKWAYSVFKIHEVTNSIEHSFLLQAHEYSRQAATSLRYAPYLRLTCLSMWIEHLPKLHDDWMEHPSVLEVCELALSLLEEQSWAASSPRLSIVSRHEQKGLGDKIVNLALVAGVNGGIARAIELMEASQALVWGQLQRLRAPIGDLETVSPELGSRFRRLSGLLESRMGLLDAELDSKAEEDGSALGTNNWQLNNDMNQVIEEIRTLPGFESFLRRRSFGEDKLREVAQDGPVVVLVDIGHALILLQDRSASVMLPITSDSLCDLHTYFQSLANSRDASGHVEESMYTDDHPFSGPSNPAGSSRSLRRARNQLSVEDLLEVLWRQVVEPILAEIFRYEGERKGKSKMWEIPKLEDRQRIWWCCLGESSFLPIHVAGIYNGSSPISLSDFFISSYTPTLTALLDARARAIPPDIKVLAAAQPTSGGGWSYLSQVKDELREIVQITPPANLISLGDTDQPDFEGKYTTVENVLKKLPEASVLHLACHGIQHLTDPLTSGFVLADAKRLTIEELMKYRLPNAHTAILSACHTASNDAEQPFEAINLSSALMFLGFSNILATKWPMNDSDGPIIAKAVYQALFDTSQRPRSTNSPVDPRESTDPEAASRNEGRHPTLASFSLAKVVDDIARHLRMEKKVPARQWATFVHVGI